MCRWLLGQWICHWPGSFVPSPNQQPQTGCSTDRNNRCKLWGGRLDNSSFISGNGYYWYKTSCFFLRSGIPSTPFVPITSEDFQ